jgi:nucleotide-binding universal stress UspA family protein
MDETGYRNRIVVGIDGSTNSAAALAWAVEEGRIRGAPVEAVHAWQVPALAYTAPGFIPPGADAMEAEGRQVLDAALGAIQGSGNVRIDLRICEGSATEVLARVSREPDVAVLAVGARGHGGVAGLLLGSVSHSLTHHANCPLVVVPKAWHPGENGTRGRVLVGVDGSAGSERALRWAVEEARLRRAPLEILMVWSLPMPVMPAHLPIHGSGGGDIGARVLDCLTASVAKVDTTGVELQLSVLEGTPARVLTTRASGADLLVVGTRGLGRAREAVSGSVSHACAHHTVVPVAVVPDKR